MMRMTMQGWRSVSVVAVSVALGLWGCAMSGQRRAAMQPNRAGGTCAVPPCGTCCMRAAGAQPNAMAKPVTEAAAVLKPTEGSQVKGTVTFTKVSDGIRVVADVTGLTPGKHGFHVHEKGDCSAPDGTSAGGHFNPTGMPHGGPDDARRHVGDLGNLVADADGNAHYDRVDSVIAFEGANSILGRGLIVHAGGDDLKSQPTGNAGARVACGKIQAEEN